MAGIFLYEPKIENSSWSGLESPANSGSWYLPSLEESSSERLLCRRRAPSRDARDQALLRCCKAIKSLAWSRLRIWIKSLQISRAYQSSEAYPTPFGWIHAKGTIRLRLICLCPCVIKSIKKKMLPPDEILFSKWFRKFYCFFFCLSLWFKYNASDGFRLVSFASQRQSGRSFMGDTSKRFPLAFNRKRFVRPRPSGVVMTSW